MTWILLVSVLDIEIDTGVGDGRCIWCVESVRLTRFEVGSMVEQLVNRFDGGP